MIVIDEAEPLRRYVEERSDTAFAEFVRRHIDLVYAAALRRTGGDSHAASDVTQQVFIAAARNAHALSRHTNMTGWLYTTTRNAALNFLRGEERRRRREREVQAAQEILVAQGPEVSAEQLRPVLDAAMDDLNDRDREAVLLRFFAGLPLAEIGARLRVSENTARMRVERALEKLRERLARRGVTSTSAALGLVLAQQTSSAAPAGLAGSIATGALAGVANANAAAGLLAFMSTTKFGAGVGALGLLLAIGTATHQWREGRRADGALQTVRNAHGTQMARLRETDARAAVLEEELAAMQRALETARKTAAAQAQRAAATPAPAAPWNAREEGAAFLARHPEVKRALDDYVGANVRFRYAPLFRELQLTAEQIEKLVAIQGQGTGMGASLGDGRPVTLSFGERPGSDWSQKIAEVIGADRTKRLTSFGAAVSARHVAADVASALYFTETPLTSEQADKLMGVLIASRQPRGAGRTSEYDWSAVVAKAGPVLAAPQVAVLAGLRAQDQFHQVLNRPRPGDRPPEKPAPKGN